MAMMGVQGNVKQRKFAAELARKIKQGYFAYALNALTRLACAAVETSLTKSANAGVASRG